MKESAQRLDEEIANSVSHGIALLVAIISVPFLLVEASRLSTAAIVGTSIFALTLVLLYLTSTLYHALPVSSAKDILLKLDHGAIYFFIAGSYTPFALGALSDIWSWVIFVVIWLFAISGAILKAFDLLSSSWLSTGLYLIMGWLVLIATIPLAGRMPMTVDVLLVAGGLAYSVGVVFFILDSRLRYAHTVWHCFVVLGTTCHFFAVLNYSV
jgi:hemolysin III